MSKYNLTDILEQYKIGSGWTTDFDYEGMLNAGLKATLEDRIESLEALAEDFTDVNYHREASHLYDALEALEKGDAFEAEGKISDFHAEIRKTMESFDMDMSDDLGAYMASKMEEGEAVDLAIEASQEKAGIEVDESFKSLAKKLDKQKGIDKDEAAKIAGSIAAKKAAGAGKGPTAKQKKRMNEEDKALNMTASAETLRKIIFKLLDDGQIQPETADDILNAVSNSPSDNVYEADAVNFNMKADEGLEDIEEALPKFKGVPPMRDIVKALKNDAKATDSEIKQFMASVKKAGDEFDDVDDYVEDFKNYVADKSLQEKQYAPEVVDRIEMVRKALYDTNNFDAKEIEAYTRSIVSDFERGDFEAYDDFKADDYVEDIKNYISDKSLREHFSRFLKPYQ